MAITAVILNWNRAYNLKYIILPWLSKHPLITEIIVSHGRKKSIFNYESKHLHCMIVHRDDSELNHEYGLSRRYLAASKAKNDHILILDDDILVLSKTIDRLFQLYHRDVKILHGLYGRAVNQNYSYISCNIYGEVPLVLTRCVLQHKVYAELFLENKSIVEDIINKGMPYWNGEDIFMSLLVTKHTSRLPFAYKLPHINLIYSEFNGISSKFNKKNNVGNKLTHFEYRDFFTRSCIQRLELESIFDCWLKSKK